MKMLPPDSLSARLYKAGLKLKKVEYTDGKRITYHKYFIMNGNVAIKAPPLQHCVNTVKQKFGIEI